MKKIYALVASGFLFANTAFAGLGCTPDVNNTQFFNPLPPDVPCAEQGVLYNEVLQFYIPATVDLADYGVPISYVLTVDSVVLDSITGLPNGLNWAQNGGPIFYGGTHGCGLTNGTTNDPTGNYPIVFHGLAWVHGQPFPGVFDGDTTLTLQQLIGAATQGGSYSIDVIAAGGTCHASGIKDFNADLNTALSVYPNPNNGNFELKLNSGRRINGEIVIVDVTGKKVFSQLLDVTGMYATSVDLTQYAKGLYTVQLRTTEGFASKNISVE